MKKLFTLVVAAFAALSVSAKEDIDISSIATDNVVTFAGQWQWKGINYGVTDEDTKVTTYADKSAFDYVVVEYTTGTCADVNLTAQYEPDGTTGQYGPNYFTSTETCNVYPAGGILAVKLDATHSAKMNAVALQNRGTAGSITVKAAYFASEAEADIEESTIVVTKVYLTSKTVAELGTSTGISNAVVAPKANPNAPIYNLAGQKVSKSYKGVVIQNGKKFVQ